jgi:hypothetical protein
VLDRSSSFLFSWEVILMAKSKLRAIHICQAVENPMCQRARHCENDFAISIKSAQEPR